MFTLYLAACVAATVVLRRRPDVVAMLALAMWVLIPAAAGELLTGIAYTAQSGLNMHPASWLVFVYVLLLSLCGRFGVNALVVRYPGYVLPLVWVVVVGTVTTGLQQTSASIRGFLDIFVAGAAWFFIALKAGTVRPNFWLSLGRLLIFLAVFNALLSCYQAAFASGGIYETYFIKYDAGYRTDVVRTQGTTDHPLVLSLLLVAAIPLVLLVRRRILRHLLIALFVIALIQSGSRTGLVVGGVGALAVLVRSVRLRMLDALALSASAVVGVLMFTSEAGARILSRFSTEARSTELRSAAYDYISHHWTEYVFAGGGFASNFTLKDTGVIHSSLENGYIMLGVDIGIAAALIFVIVLLHVIVVGWRSGSAKPAILSALLVLVTIATFSSIGTRTASLSLVWAATAIVATGAGQSLIRRQVENRADVGSAEAVHRRRAAKKVGLRIAKVGF